MKYFKVTNPIVNELTLQFEGEVYTLGAKESRSFPENVTNHWKFIYGFVIVSADEPKIVEKKVEDIKPKTVKK